VSDAAAAGPGRRAAETSGEQATRWRTRHWPRAAGSTRHADREQTISHEKRREHLCMFLAPGRYEQLEGRDSARNASGCRVMSAKAAGQEKNARRALRRLRPLVADKHLFQAPTMTMERPRPQQTTFIGALIFLVIILTIFTYHSSHYEGSEGHSIALAHSSKVGLPNYEESMQTEAMAKVEESQTAFLIHPQCSRGTSDLKNRPMIIFKSARTGSTWLGLTFQELKLKSGKEILLTTEVNACGKIFNSQLAKWFVKFFNQGRKGAEANENLSSKNRHGRRLKLKCRVDENGNKTFGPIVATLDVKSNPDNMPDDEAVPDLTLDQWGEVFKAVPDLAIGVLVRTNAVKRAISSIAVEEQIQICGDKVGKKLTGREKCIKDLPEQIHLNTTELWSHVEKSDRKRTKLPELAARLSSKYSDGKIFCVSYEEMELDMPNVMEDMGRFVGADIDPKSLPALREKQVSKKRGSDDLSAYISNYDEVRENLSTNKCVLEQLESKKPKVFPACYK
jgi:hypothetical protein